MNDAWLDPKARKISQWLVVALFISMTVCVVRWTVLEDFITRLPAGGLDEVDVDSR